MEHAKLTSPSAADRWSVCTASAEVCPAYEDKPGPDALKGLAAHALLEKSILQRKHPRLIDPDHPALDGVSLAYAQVLPVLVDPACYVYTETVVQYSEDLWGTADVIVIKPDGLMLVIDYKNGVIPVEADCLQLLIYSAAALKTMAWLSPVPITAVGCLIIQPNGLSGPKVKEHMRTAEEVDCEMEEKILPAVDVIMSAGDPSVKTQPEFVVSEKGCKWCPHGRAGNCEALAATALDSVKARFDDLGALVVPETSRVDSLTDDQVAKVLEARPLFKKFLEGVENRAMQTVKSGGKVPGFKMVAGRTNRSWSHTTDTETLEFLTKTLKFKRREVVSDKVATPAVVEKMINSLKRNKDAKLDLFKDAVENKEGKLTLVSADSKKKEIVMFQEIPAIDAGSVLG